MENISSNYSLLPPIPILINVQFTSQGLQRLRTLELTSTQNLCLRGTEIPKALKHIKIEVKTVQSSVLYMPRLCRIPYSFPNAIITGVNLYQMLDTYACPELNKYHRMLFLSRIKLLFTFHAQSVLFWMRCFPVNELEYMVLLAGQKGDPTWAH